MWTKSLAFSSMSITVTLAGSTQYINKNLMGFALFFYIDCQQKTQLHFYLVLGREMRAMNFSPYLLLKISLNLIKFHYFRAYFLKNICQQKVKHCNQKTSSTML